MIRFIIGDNQDITRAGLHGFISLLYKDAVEIEDVTDKKQLIEELVIHEESIVILDYSLFDFKGLDDFLIVSRRFPEVNWIMFSNELSEEAVRRLSAETRAGIILKENEAEEIVLALKEAVKGERFLCHQISNMLLIESSKSDVRSILTPTEVEILKLIAHGKTVKEIAAMRYSSAHTIITHKKNIFRKLDVNNIYEATKYAVRAGLIDLVEYYI